jgi:heme o synthase
MKSVISSYVSLTKPTIVLLFALTGLTAMVVEGSLLQEPGRMWVILVGIILTAGSANALNMYFDRDIDLIMKRTRKRRPLPLQQISPNHALWFGIITGAVATGLLLWFANLLSALIGVGTILFYVGIYTLILKRRTPYNIVICGAAGATAPLIGWAAATGEISLSAWLMFLIIFMWTPPHFWALALVVKEDYREAKVPMLPVVAGEKRTRLEMLIYTVLLVPLTLAPALVRLGGPTYSIGSVILDIIFVWEALIVMRKKTDKSAYAMFWYSIIYLLALFFLLMVGALIHGRVP